MRGKGCAQQAPNQEEHLYYLEKALWPQKEGARPGTDPALRPGSLGRARGLERWGAAGRWGGTAGNRGVQHEERRESPECDFCKSPVGSLRNWTRCVESASHPEKAVL